jgi:HD-like signal output (HDOD) protein
MIVWLKRALGMSAKAAPVRGSGTAPRLVPEKQAFDWSTFVEPPKVAPAPVDPDPFPELADWTALVYAKCTMSWDSLSAFPPIATKIFSLLEHPDFKLQELVNLIHQDPTISAEVLRAANSAAFSRGATSLDIRDAVQRLGAREVASIAAASSTRSLFDMESRVAHEQVSELARRLWLHSMTCAFTAGWLAMDCGRGNLDRCFLGGMLHDIGKTVGLRGLSTLAISGELPTPISEERIERVLDAVHLRLGGEAVVRWSLPEFFQQLCTGHHGEVPESLITNRDFHIVRLVSGMNMLRTNMKPELEPLEESREMLGMTPQSLNYLYTSMKSYADRASQLAFE